MANFDKVAEALETAKGIAFDGCHKIYVLMDNNQMELMQDYGYDLLISIDDMNEAEMLETIQKWYSESCGLRFVQSVATTENPEDQNDGFTTLIGQFEDEECEDCGEEGCAGVCNDNCDNCGQPGNCGCDDEEEEDDNE